MLSKIIFKIVNITPKIQQVNDERLKQKCHEPYCNRIP